MRFREIDGRSRPWSPLPLAPRLLNVEAPIKRHLVSPNKAIRELVLQPRVSGALVHSVRFSATRGKTADAAAWGDYAGEKPDTHTPTHAHVHTHTTLKKPAQNDPQQRNKIS